MGYNLKLDSCSLHDLQVLEAQIANAKEKIRDEAIESARRQIHSLLEALGLSVGEVFSSSVRTPRGAHYSGVPKFMNPSNRREIWTGKGRHPNWLKTKLASGVSLEAFRVVAGKVPRTA